MFKYFLLMTEVPDLLQAGIPRDGLQCTEHFKYMGTTCGGAVVLNDLEEFGLFEADEKSVSRQMLKAKCREKPGTRSPGSNQRHLWLADRKIALYRLRQILNYKKDGSLVNLGASLSNERRKPQRVLIMDIRRNADRLTLIYSNTATLPVLGRVYTY